MVAVFFAEETLVEKAARRLFLGEALEFVGLHLLQLISETGFVQREINVLEGVFFLTLSCH